MPHKFWMPRIDGKNIRVEVKWSSSNGEGQLFVDGILTHNWKTDFTSGLTKFFRIAGKPASIQHTKLSYILRIDGKEENSIGQI